MLFPVLKSETISFKYKTKSVGPSIDPWGTPDRTGNSPEVDPPTCKGKQATNDLVIFAKNYTSLIRTPFAHNFAKFQYFSINLVLFVNQEKLKACKMWISQPKNC